MSYQLKRLLPRHRKLMDLMLTGMTQKEAAARLMISKRCASYTVNLTPSWETDPSIVRES